MKSGGSPRILEAINAGFDVKKLKKLIHQVRALHLNHTNFEYLKSILIPLLGGYFAPRMTISADEFIFRAVLWADKPKNKAQLSYPPAPIVKFGRANIPHRPMFYGNSGLQSTILELEPSQGDRFVISKWRVKKNLILTCVGYTKRAFKGKSGMNRLLEIPWVDHNDINHLSHKRGNQYCEEFLAHEFTKRVSNGKEWEYKISAAISEMLMNAKSFGINGAPPIQIAGLIYPSEPNEGNSDNVAIKCDIADQSLEFVSVQYITVFSKTDQFVYKLVGLDYANSLLENGDIEWENSFPDQIIPGTELTRKYDGKYLELFDAKGISLEKKPYNQDTELIINFRTISN